MRNRLENFDKDQDRGNPNKARELFNVLWPSQAVRIACAKRLAKSIRYAHEQADASWEVSMFAWGIRLNVGQVLVLQFDSDEVLAYARSSRGKSEYDAVRVPSRVLRFTPTKIAADRSKDWRDHELFISAAANAKKGSPWSKSFSEGVVEHIESLLHTTLPRPTYLKVAIKSQGGSASHPICVYTIRNADMLHEDWRDGGSFSFTENRHWTQAAKQLALAKQSGRIFPIIFADARATRYLIYRGAIDGIRISAGQNRSSTIIAVINLDKIAEVVPKTRLIIASSGRNIPARHIRPYVICRTPNWLYTLQFVPKPLLEIFDLPSAAEGRRQLVSHFRVERNRALIEKKKIAFKKDTGGLACEVCKFDFCTYGSLGNGYCEVHHLRPLSETISEVRTSLKDLAVVCANCHRMIHRGGQSRSLSKIRASLRFQ